MIGISMTTPTHVDEIPLPTTKRHSHGGTKWTFDLKNMSQTFKVNFKRTNLNGKLAFHLVYRTFH
jgi:hypothetical protein